MAEQEVQLPHDDDDSSDESDDETVGANRPQRQRTLPARLNDYVVITDDAVNSEGDLVELDLLADVEPTSYTDALKEKVWKDAMIEELNSIEKNKTWMLTTLPAEKKTISVKWVFKVKLNPDGTVAKHKARLVARGFLQRPGLDYFDVFAPVARHDTMRMVIGLASNKGWGLYHLDVKSAFLNGPLSEEVYVLQPPGFEKKGKEQMVYKLHKALYGLKQAPRAWNKKIDSYFVELGFKKCLVEHGIYVRDSKDGEKILVCLYVDDMLITGGSVAEITEFKEKLMNTFEMTDLGKVSYFLGMQFLYEPKGIVLHQMKYAGEILKRFKMENCKVAATPAEVNLRLDADDEGEEVDPTLFKQLVGCLRYLCNTRPDICHSVGVVSRFMGKPKLSHFHAATRILKYVRGTLRYGILFPTSIAMNVDELLGYSDADWCGDKVDRRSTTGYIFLWNGAPISWSSKKQPVVALSSCESEYVAGAVTACQGIWLNTLMTELKIAVKKPVKLLIDNKSAISLAKNPVLHGRSKHIDTKFHFLREQVEKGNIKVCYCRTQMQVADILTKGLKADQFLKLRTELGVTTF